ncbi:putative MFS family arabinose efflux permease [Paucimonas lemoignei]|uniref:Putative MFS family arabinose efflux permease n=1 Tax=Paucimonas lemoignei TaxID=29443 RepID=A0A4R3HYW8_PAULE|nr:MFS transporter [Paucimonas lemoignei]TCS38546.1 putative MFS family arabinose efflux permease [Paucimonas lemoignei]
MSELPPLPRLRVVHLLAIAGFYFCSGAFLMQFPRIILRLGGSAQEIGWILALGLIPVLCLAGVVGNWNRQRGGRWPLVVGALLAALSNAMMIWVEHVGAGMLALRMLFAVGHAMIFGTLFAQAAFVADHPLQRAKVIGWMAVVIQIGNAIGSVIGEYAYLKGNNAFWLGSAGIGLIVVVLGACWSTKPANEHSTQTQAGSKSAQWPAEVWTIAAVGMAFAGLSQFLPAFIDHLNQSGAVTQPFAAAWFLTPALLLVALVRLAGGHFAAVLLRPWVLGVCHLLLMLTMLLVPWMHTQQHAMFLGMIFGLSYGWLYPALSAMAFDHVPAEARGRVAGWLVAAFEVGFRLSPIALGALISRFGYTTMFVSLVLAYAGMLLVARLVARTKLVPVPAAL